MIRLLALAILAALTSADAQSTPRCDANRSLRVLFIGNSFTYVNNAPRMVEQIASALSGPCIAAEMIAQGGATLRGHWDADSAAARIATGRFTHVVIQEQSTFGAQWWVNGRFRVPDSSAALAEYGGKFIERIKAAKAQPIVLAHWSGNGAPARDQMALDHAFRELATRSGATLSPVGRAVKALASDSAAPSPYHADGHHLSAAGSYLEALVLYNTLTTKPAVDVPARITGAMVDFQRGEVFRDSVVTLVDLPAEVARRIQQLAATSYDSWQRAVKSAERPAPLSAEFPVVPARGEAVELNALQGRWMGRTNVLPAPGDQPLAVEVVLGASGDSVYLRVPEMEYAGAITASVQGATVVLTGSVAARGRARRGGPPVPFQLEVRAALKGATLEGVAIMRQAAIGTMPSLDAIGSFTVKR